MVQDVRCQFELTSCSILAEQAGKPVPQKVNFLVEQTGKPFHQKLMENGARFKFERGKGVEKPDLSLHD